jgi:hypothetical protein
MPDDMWIDDVLPERRYKGMTLLVTYYNHGLPYPMLML